MIIIIKVIIKQIKQIGIIEIYNYKICNILIKIIIIIVIVIIQKY